MRWWKCTRCPPWRGWASCSEPEALFSCWRDHSCYAGDPERCSQHTPRDLSRGDSVPLCRLTHQRNSSGSASWHITVLSDQDLLLHGVRPQGGNLVIPISVWQLRCKSKTAVWHPDFTRSSCELCKWSATARKWILDGVYRTPRPRVPELPKEPPKVMCFPGARR